MQRDVVVRAQAGDVDAFSALTFDATKRLHATARLILREDEAAKDAVQDALLGAWLNLRSLRDPDRFDAWLHRLLINACYRTAKRRRVRDVVELTVSTDRGDTPDVQRDLALRDQLERGFRRLPIDQRAVLVVRHYMGLSLLETADVLGVPLGTVQSRLNRATAAMRAALEADDRVADLATETAG
ncbi:MAG: RNA polymerase sigma factor [Chloroflexota bacterium]